MSIRTRFILTGACLPSYSGKQVQLTFPLESESGEPTTTADMKDLIRRQWPENMSEMKNVVESTEMRVLKGGNLLSDDVQIRSVLTATELSECSVATDGEGDKPEEDQKSVLMHLVFQSSQSYANKADEPRPTQQPVAQQDSCCCTVL
uniref:UBL3-like ubiquitin domain-containing protein n=1 Tax=Trypanosoma congolense (strain IL3000) TaxID=1068625 RepID=G0UV52_TRYCI|nr:conserved hypothetical protein [Trypanosoma congolense IL3000]